jgi:hypothetical protein
VEESAFKYKEKNLGILETGMKYEKCDSISYFLPSSHWQVVP